MFTFIKKPKDTPLSPLDIDNDKRTSGCRRVSFDTKYLGLGKCIDRRQAVRRKADRFDSEAYEEECRKWQGPGWL